MEEQSSVAFDPELERTLHRALNDAENRRNEEATLEHILLSLVDDRDASEVFKACGVNVLNLRHRVERYIDIELPRKVFDSDTKVTESFQRVVQRAIIHVQSTGRKVVNGANLLIALFAERDSQAVQILNDFEISRLDAVTYISHGIGKSIPNIVDEVEEVSALDFKKDFFISYSTDDQFIAMEIDEILTAFGYSTVAQFKDFRPGSNFVTEMQGALQVSLRVIAVYSPSYFSSEHCQAEWNAAYAVDPSGRQRKILPFLIEPSELTPLARQVVYTSLVGMDRKERAAAIYKAISDDVAGSKGKFSSTALEELMSRTVSPNVAIDSGKLGVVFNDQVDEVVDFATLMETCKQAEEIGGVIVESLPSNSPPVVRFSIIRYCDHISENRRHPISGILSSMASAVEREFSSIDSDLWGAGLGSLMSDFLKNHSRLIASLKGSSEKDMAIQSVSLASDDVDRRAVANLVEDGQVALETLVSENVVNKEFRTFVEDQREILAATDLADIGGDRSRKSFFARIVVNAVGFYKRVSEVAASSLTVAESQSVGAALRVLRDVVKRILDLISGA